MKIYTLIVLCCTFLLGCASNPSTPENIEKGTRITDESIEDLFNKKIFFIDSEGKEKRDNYFVLRDDGNAEGTWNSQPLFATWEMRDDYWCRVLVEFYNSDRVGPEDCQLWEQEGNNIRVTRDKGNGNSYMQRIAEE